MNNIFFKVNQLVIERMQLYARCVGIDNRAILRNANFSNVVILTVVPNLVVEVAPMV